MSKKKKFHRTVGDKKKSNTPPDQYCCIPDHAWLAVVLDDYLDRLDPVRIVSGRITPHEYLPEIPDLLVLLTTNTISSKNVKKVFEKFFGPGQISDMNSERIADFLTHKREHWLLMTQQKQ
jgi:hypothetical protein